MPKTVTLLFTDLVGSTELLSRVGAEHNDALRREHFGLLRDSAREHGGVEVKNLGDGLMVAFEGATDAVSCACDMQQRLDVRNKVADERLSVRVGIATGEATIEDDDYFGVPVVEAARLCARAGGDEILVTGLVRALAGSRSGVTFEALGALELKGLDEPVETSRVVWSTAAARAWQSALPPRLAGADSSEFVGRVGARAQLRETVTDTVSGRQRRVVLLEGEAGIGKTTLVSTVAASARDLGAVVLYGRNDEDLGIPYQAWGEALAELVGVAPESLLRAHVEARGAELLTLVPGLRDRVADVPASAASHAEAERHLLFGAVVDVLRRASSQVPVVVVLDDLHWSDRESIQLLRHVIGASVGMPLLLVGTYRASEIDAGHPVTDLLGALHREDGVDRLALHGLDADDVLALMEGIAGHDLAADAGALRDELLAETDGNPFFLIEILRHLAETGAITRQGDGRWAAAAGAMGRGLPVSVREVVGRRVAALGETTARVLSVAAVIGRDFDLPLLVSATGIDADELVDTLDNATRAALVQPISERHDTYTFVHALIQHTLYEGLSVARRRRDHERIAEALEALPGAAVRIAELARHWNEAVQPTSVEKAYEYALAAGDEAARRLAPTDATRWYAQALDLTGRLAAPDAARGDALLRLGDAQRLAGDAAFRETLLAAAELAHELGEVNRLSAAVLANTRGFVSVVGAVDDERIAMLQAALTYDDVPAETRARILAQLSVETHYAPDVDTQALIDEALAITEQLDDDTARADALRALHLYFVPSTLDRRLASIEECERIAAHADAHGRLRMAMNLVPTLIQAGRFREAWDQMDRIRVAADELGDPSGRWVEAWLAFIRFYAEGDLTAADAQAAEALQLGMDAGEPDALTFYGAQLAAVRNVQGRPEEIIDALIQASEANPGIAALQAGIALGLSIMGETARVHEILDAYCEAGLADLFPETPLRLGSLGTLGGAAVRVGHVETARAIVPLLTPYRDQVVFVGVSIGNPILHVLAGCEMLLGDDDAAEATFAEALVFAEQRAVPYWVAYTKLDWARYVGTRKYPDAVRARELLREAAFVAEAHGFGELTRAVALLDAMLPVSA